MALNIQGAECVSLIFDFSNPPFIYLNNIFKPPFNQYKLRWSLKATVFPSSSVNGGPGSSAFTTRSRFLFGNAVLKLKAARFSHVLYLQAENHVGHCVRNKRWEEVIVVIAFFAIPGYQSCFFLLYVTFFLFFSKKT